MKKILPLLLCTAVMPAHADILPLNDALIRTHNACAGISDSVHKLSVKAGINTAVTGVGTVASGVALGAGIAKNKVDDFLSEETKRILDKYANQPQDKIVIQDWAKFEADLDALIQAASANSASGGLASAAELEQLEQAKSKSQKLGNLRTGTLAASSVANIAGTAIAATNTSDRELQPRVDECIAAVQELSQSYMAARVAGSATDSELAHASDVMDACGEWELIDLSPIDNRAKGAAVFSGIAAGTGVVGTITSSLATSKQHQSNHQGLDTASNVMAGATAVTGATATVFNATQISAIKKAAAAAEKCEGALN